LSAQSGRLPGGPVGRGLLWSRPPGRAAMFGAGGRRREALRRLRPKTVTSPGKSEDIPRIERGEVAPASKSDPDCPSRGDPACDTPPRATGPGPRRQARGETGRAEHKMRVRVPDAQPRAGLGPAASAFRIGPDNSRRDRSPGTAPLQAMKGPSLSPGGRGAIPSLFHTWSGRGIGVLINPRVRRTVGSREGIFASTCPGAGCGYLPAGACRMARSVVRAGPRRTGGRRKHPPPYARYCLYLRDLPPRL
jgi:hypothetical protein